MNVGYTLSSGATNELENLSLARSIVPGKSLGPRSFQSNHLSIGLLEPFRSKCNLPLLLPIAEAEIADGPQLRLRGTSEKV
jgi:hypothetical protein